MSSSVLHVTGDREVLSVREQLLRPERWLQIDQRDRQAGLPNTSLLASTAARTLG